MKIYLHSRNKDGMNNFTKFLNVFQANIFLMLRAESEEVTW